MPKIEKYQIQKNLPKRFLWNNLFNKALSFRGKDPKIGVFTGKDAKGYFYICIC